MIPLPDHLPFLQIIFLSFTWKKERPRYGTSVIVNSDIGSADDLQSVPLYPYRRCLIQSYPDQLWRLLDQVDQIELAVYAYCSRLMMASANRSISSNCGLHCNKKKLTPSASNAAMRSSTCAGVPISPERSPRLDTE